MSNSETKPHEPAMRADARLNRERILIAACDVFVELGPDAPLEEVVDRAGVGFGTLYRRFPDRAALNRAVVIYVLERTAAITEEALASESGASFVLARYMHAALDLRVGAVVPALLDRVSMDDEEIVRLRRQGAQSIEEMIAQAQAGGHLRTDVGFADISLLLIRMSRPLPGPISPRLENELAHRHLDILLEGLKGSPNYQSTPLRGPMLTLEDLQSLRTERD